MGINKRLLFAALLIGGLSVSFILLYGKRQDDKVAELIGNSAEIVRAEGEIPAGTILSKEMIYTEKVPIQYLPPNPIDSDLLPYYIGAKSSLPIKEGAMLLTSDFVTPARPTRLADKVIPNERAYTISVDELSGFAGLLEPGDRVDLIALFKDNVGEQEAITNSESRSVTLLQNLPILAVGSRLNVYKPSVVQTQEEAWQNHSDERPMYRSITLSVTPQDAELLTLVKEHAKLSVTLRGREDRDTLEYESKSLEDILKAYRIVATETIGEDRKEAENKREETPKSVKKHTRKRSRIEIIRGGVL